MTIEKLIQEYVDGCEGVGAAVGVIDQGKIQFFTYGPSISVETIFEIGSITKVFTSLILMDMVTNGDIRLDDPIEMHLPDVNVPEFEGRKITLRHLATHHSGLPAMPDNLNPKDPKNPFADFAIEDLYQFLKQYKLQIAPGDRFEYSNVGMGLLGHILGKIRGFDFEELVRSHICEKLEMNNTKIILSNEMEKHFAKGYHKKQEMPYLDIPALAGAGALRSNIREMTQFLTVSMGLLDSPLSNLIAQCQKKQFSAAGPNCDAIGLGWLLSHSSDADIIWHNGGTGGFRSFLGFNAKAQKGVVVLSNSTEGWPDEFALSLLNPAYTKPAINQSLAQDLDYLQQFVGSYELSMGQQKIASTIKLEENGLAFIIPEGEVKLLPETKGVFSLKGMAGQKLRFIFDEAQNILEAQVVQSNGPIVAVILPKK